MTQKEKSFRRSRDTIQERVESTSQRIVTALLARETHRHAASSSVFSSMSCARRDMMRARFITDVAAHPGAAAAAASVAMRICRRFRSISKGTRGDDSRRRCARRGGLGPIFWCGDGRRGHNRPIDAVRNTESDRRTREPLRTGGRPMADAPPPACTWGRATRPPAWRGCCSRATPWSWTPQARC